MSKRLIDNQRFTRETNYHFSFSDILARKRLVSDYSFRYLTKVNASLAEGNYISWVNAKTKGLTRTVSLVLV